MKMLIELDQKEAVEIFKGIRLRKEQIRNKAENSEDYNTCMVVMEKLEELYLGARLYDVLKDRIKPRS
jgi:hypothetical protein